jgi:ABC-2 type transport system ATP-binding protein
MIELLNLVKKFGELVAVNDLSLTVPKGEFFAVLGPNAAGKTTTIKMLTGLIKPTAGRALIGGFDVQEHPLEARRRLAYVPDFPFLYDKLTPWEFFRFTGQMFQMTDDQIDASARVLVPRFNLEPYVKSAIEGLSHGTRQRVAIVAALLHDPEVFVIDEPMVGLDPHHARVVKDVLKERSLKGMTVFLSTHQLSVAEEMADRIGIIHRGKLIAVGTHAELRKLAGHEGPLEQAFLTLTAEEDTAAVEI